ncbi:MAG: anthranilate/aminodeoxychorismate synthase component II [Blastocatellia bacterium AA13]|nr:MAG: anthranilate/aminodeoxychorismate synthase component II [Blastocatellia bacterium AA13]
MVLVIDNYDSFTFNLVQYIGELGKDVEVRRNNQITIEEIEALKPDHIVISPGPGIPEAAGVSIPIVRELGGKIPILGVCLGHQAIGVAFGGSVIRAPYLMHGKTTEICHDSRSIFKGLPYRFKATRYHSLIVEKQTLPDCLEVSATAPDGLIMGVRHREFLLEGVQFHPESIVTEHGKKLVNNFLSL